MLKDKIFLEVKIQISENKEHSLVLLLYLPN